MLYFHMYQNIIFSNCIINCVFNRSHEIWWLVQVVKSTGFSLVCMARFQYCELLGFPSPAVVSAYLNPMVDDSREPFTWGTPDVAALRDYAERKFGWSRSRTDQVLLPAVNKLSQRTVSITTMLTLGLLGTFMSQIPNILLWYISSIIVIFL